MATRNLYMGCTGSDVKTLQKNLKTLGYYQSGAVDGIFGSLTDAAVRQFQRANGLVVDGIVGPKTRAALSGKLKKKSGTTVKKSPTTKKTSTTTREVARWGGHKFVVSPNLVRGFSGLQIKASSELKDKKNSSQGVVSRKGANPTEISLTVHLNAFTGCNVRDEAMKFIKEASDGKNDYFYIGDQKLVSCKLMLTDASVKELGFTQTGKWTNAEVSLTMKQCGKNSGSSSSGSGTKSGSGSSGGGSGGSSKASTKTASPTSSTSSNRNTPLDKTVSGSTTKNKVSNPLTGKSSYDTTTKTVKEKNAAARKVGNTAKKATVTAKYGGAGRYGTVR